MMLPRIANAHYCMARELERAQFVARLLEVSAATSLEGALANGAGRRDVWEAAVAITGDTEAFHERHLRAEGRSVTWYLSLSDWSRHGAVGCLARAREHAGTIRSLLPTEVFEAIGAADSAARAWSPGRVARDGMFTFCREVRDGVAAVDGMIDRGMRRDANWELVRLGRYLERATQVTRLLAVHGALLRTEPRTDLGIGDWRVVLRVASAYEAYLRVALSERDRPSAAAFLLLDAALPGSVAYALGEVFDAIEGLRRLGAAPADPAPKAAVFAASRAAADAAQPMGLERGTERLAARLAALHEVCESIIFPNPEVADGAHAQAARQAQN